MKSLKQLLEDIIDQQEGEDNTLEIPNKNLIISFFENERRLNLAPIEPGRPSTEARNLINQIKTKFKVSEVKQESNSLFEVIFDPRTEFPLVIDFVKKQTGNV